MKPAPGQTKRAELAVRAYRQLAAPPPPPRKFVLQSRLDALLTILEADETQFYYAQTRTLADR